MHIKDVIHANNKDSKFTHRLSAPSMAIAVMSNPRSTSWGLLTQLSDPKAEGAEFSQPLVPDISTTDLYLTQLLRIRVNIYFFPIHMLVNKRVQTFEINAFASGLCAGRFQNMMFTYCYRHMCGIAFETSWERE